MLLLLVVIIASLSTSCSHSMLHHLIARRQHQSELSRGGKASSAQSTFTPELMRPVNRPTIIFTACYMQWIAALPAKSCSLSHTDRGSPNYSACAGKVGVERINWCLNLDKKCCNLKVNQSKPIKPVDFFYCVSSSLLRFEIDFSFDYCSASLSMQ